MERELELLGFSRIEARVYMALLELGPVFAGKIVTKTKQHRQQVYDALKGLETKGQISVTRKNGKNLFSPADPKRLRSIVEKQESALDAVLPMLLEKFTAPHEEVLIYRDVDGFRTALQNRIDTAGKGDFVKVIGATGKQFYELTKGFFGDYLAELDRKGSGIQWIIYESQLDEFTEHFGQFLKKNAEARLLSGTQHSPVATVILKDRVQISLFQPSPTVIEIRNQSLADEYKKYFQVLWQKAIKI